MTNALLPGSGKSKTQEIREGCEGRKTSVPSDRCDSNLNLDFVRIVDDVLSQGSGRGLWSLVLLGERRGFTYI